MLYDDDDVCGVFHVYDDDVYVYVLQIMFYDVYGVFHVFCDVFYDIQDP